MLIKRIATALVLAPIIILASIKFPTDYFAMFWGAFILFAAWEWGNLADSRIFGKAMLIMALILSMVLVVRWTSFLQQLQLLTDSMQVYEYAGILDWFVVGPVIWWLLAMILIRNAPQSLITLQIKSTYLLFLGWFILFSAWIFLVRLQKLHDVELILYLFLLVWVADITAFFVGKALGTTKLAPKISPGKTVAGMIGSMVSALVCSILLAFYFCIKISCLSMLVATQFVTLSVFTVLVSIYGDLFISLLKRKRGLKNSGGLLPGHGGLLDRIDSLIAATPIFYAGIMLIQMQFI